MFTYEFKTCTTKEKEIYDFVEHRSEDQQIFSREIEFPGSLLSFLHWDIEFMMREFQQLADGTRRVIESGDSAAWDDTYALLQRLADYHIYFELLRLDWEYRFSQMRGSGQASSENTLFVTWLEELPERLTKEQWERVKAVLPPEKTGKRGRPRKDDWKMLNGMLWIVRSGAQWRELPEVYGPWQSVYARFAKWRDDGTLEAIFRVLSADADMENLSLDSTCIKVHESANGGGKNGG